MQQVTPQQVDYIAPRVAAGANAAMAQALDRMAAQLNSDAAVMRQDEGIQWAAQNPLTPEQFEAAKNGKVEETGISQNPFSVFDRAVRKARSIELSSHFEMEGRNELVKMLAQIESDPNMKPDVIDQKIRTMTDGVSKSLAQVDADAAYKFRASMATYGNGVLRQAYEVQLKREKAIREAKVDEDFRNRTRLLENQASKDPENFIAYADLFRKDVLNQAVTLGDLQIQTKYAAMIEPAIRDAKINAVSKVLMQEQYLANPRAADKLLTAGAVPGVEAIVKDLQANDNQAVVSIRDNLYKAARARKEGIELAMADSVREGDDILRRIYSSTSPKEQTELFKQLSALPVDPSKIRSARDFMASDAAAGPQRDDLAAFGRLSQRVSLGLATDQEIISAPLTRATKKQLLQQWGNAGDDLSYGVNQINLSVGIQSGNLPPELKSAEARTLAVETRNTLAQELYQYSRTPDAQGRLPTPSDIRIKGDELAKKAKGGMSKAFTKAAESSKNSAVLSLPELNGVDLNDPTAVDAAIAKATKRKADMTLINAAKSAVEEYRTNLRKVEEGKQ